MISALENLSGREVTTTESRLLSLGDRPTKFDWFGPGAVSHLAFGAIVTFRSDYLQRLPVKERTRWFRELALRNASGTSSWWLNLRLVNAVAVLPRKWSAQERVEIERWLRTLKSDDARDVQSWKRRILSILFASGSRHLEREVAGLVHGKVHLEDAPDVIVDYLRGIGKVRSAGVYAEARKVLAQVEQAGLASNAWLEVLRRVGRGASSGVRRRIDALIQVIVRRPHWRAQS
jgi:hypothetical protein